MGDYTMQLSVTIHAYSECKPFSLLYSVVSELIHYQSNTKELRDQDENTPLHLACMNGHLEVARMLLVPRLLTEKYV